MVAMHVGWGTYCRIDCFDVCIHRTQVIRLLRRPEGHPDIEAFIQEGLHDFLSAKPPMAHLVVVLHSLGLVRGRRSASRRSTADSSPDDAAADRDVPAATAARRGMLKRLVAGLSQSGINPRFDLTFFVTHSSHKSLIKCPDP